MKKFLMGAIPALVLSFTVPAMAEHHEAGHAPAAASATEVKDIVDTASANADFSTLVTALKAAGLVDVLKGEGPFTVFAPTNEAFAKLPKGTVEEWLKPENKDKLAAVLKHHVVKSKVASADAKGKKTDLTTEAGDMLAVDATADDVLVGGAKVVKADVEAKNGVIHAIDTVLVPAEKK